MGHLSLWRLCFLASGFWTALARAAGPGLPACHLGGCPADTEGGGGGALSLLQADGAKAAAVVRRRSSQLPDAIGEQNVEEEVEPFASLLQVHQQTVETVWRLSTSSRARSIFSAVVVLPALGFAATILAIAATVVVEQKASTAAQRTDGVPGRPALAQAGDVWLSPWSIYKGFRSILLGEEPPAAIAPPRGSSKASARHRRPGAESMLPKQPDMGGLGTGTYSPSFGEHLNLLPPADSGMMLGSMGPQVMGETVIITHVPEAGRLGLKLTDDTLEITGFSDERAQTYGFRLGDRVLKVNGISVAEQQDFLQEVAHALELYRTRGQPLSFTVVHQGPSNVAFDAGPQQPPMPAPQAVPQATPQQTPSMSGAARDVTVARGLPPLPGQGHRPAADASAAPRTPPSTSSTRGAAMLGSWVYSDDTGDYTYQISREATGLLLRFSQNVPSVGLVDGNLSPVGEGRYEGTLSLPSGIRHGNIRLRYDPDRDEMISELKLKGGSAWGEEVRSQRLPGPRSPMPRAPGGGQHSQANAPSAVNFASVPASPASLQAYDHATPPSQQQLTLPEPRS